MATGKSAPSLIDLCWNLEKTMQTLSVEEIEEVSGGNMPEGSVGGDTDPT